MFSRYHHEAGRHQPSREGQGNHVSSQRTQQHPGHQRGRQPAAGVAEDQLRHRAERDVAAPPVIVLATLPRPGCPEDRAAKLPGRDLEDARAEGNGIIQRCRERLEHLAV
jgi:hypothetical protein